MKKLLLFLCLIFCFQISAQEDAWVFIKDKPQETSFLNNPISILTQRSLDRRSKLNIPLDSKDVPVDEAYYNQLNNDKTVTVLGKSKWLNAVHVQGEVAAINTLITNYSFIASIEFANKSLNLNGKSKGKTITPNHYNKLNETLTDFNYGATDNQIKMLKGDYLHQQELTGEGQIIAIIDAGFPNVNTLDAFSRIRDNNQILGGYNFADRNDNFYTRNSHGTHVLSSIAAYIKDEYVGTAPDAKFYLFISEISETETVLEETLWVEAAERADSLGVDVINTSLGYTTYDNPNHNHTYADMDGKTTFISRGAEIGASRGLLLVNAVGNDGANSWKYMGAPADAPSVISVGAVNSSGNIASFSSFGPTSDGRIKPEILGKGQNPALIDYSSGEITTSSSGTSFSSPIMAGLIACLNQSEGFLLKSSLKKSSENYNDYLKTSIYESADKFKNPTDQHGYGIPNFETALNSYIASLSLIQDELINFKISPNPVQYSFTISTDDFEDVSIQIYTILGKKVFEKAAVTSKNIDISFLNTGIYLLKISKGNQQKNIKIIKQ
ncbi:S8 family serine peptidase [Polaribacter undariae]|uniref:S8 family serine peptidase n=1 Tax=Polaribacter sejongensis TaxID=985043 RepID=A0AAJ1QVD2_9FLAO|nr:S8 family serine peptidase [Polaribacter undariae]MDN3618790.1 S8 family serine peptidase [Polaribacter undariae]UWD32881.1 S8 family serine peptidase [Polaribacter undariae]